MADITLDVSAFSPVPTMDASAFTPVAPAALPPGVPTAAQEALQQPAIDPTFVAADALTAGGASLEPGVVAALKAGGKAALSSGLFQKGADLAMRATGKALPGHPYIQAAAGLVLPMIVDVGARRAAGYVLPPREPIPPVAEPAPTTTIPGQTQVELNGRQVAPESVGIQNAPPVAAPAAPVQGEGLGNAPQERAPIVENTSPAPEVPPTAFSPVEATPVGEKSVEQMPGASIFRITREKVGLKPEVYQHKLGADTETGGGLALTDVKKFDVGKSGVLTVHHTGEYGTPSSQYYVVNGHQRLGAADRLNFKEPLRYQVLDEGNTHPGAIASNVTPQAARAYGAIINLAEGRGTALDAAKFMRDIGATNPIQMLENEGVSLTEKKATDAVALTGLSDRIFRDVTLGRFPENRAVIIGRELNDNKPGQDAIYQSVRELEDKGQDISDKKLVELIRIAKGAGNYTENQTDLFGTRALEKSYAPQMADVLSYTRGELGKEKRVFGTAEKNAARLEQGGSNIDVEQAAAIQQGAATRGDLLDRFAYASGTNANAAVRKYAELLAKSPKSARSGVLQDAYKDIYDALDQDYQEAFNSQQGLAGTSPEAGPGQGNLLAGRVSPRGEEAPKSETPRAPVSQDAAFAANEERQRIAAKANEASAAATQAATSPEAAAGARAAADYSREELLRRETEERQPPIGSGPGEFQSGRVVVPQTAQSVASGLKAANREIREVFAPHTVTRESAGAAALMDRRNAQMESNLALGYRQIESARKFMGERTPTENLDFMDRYEAGRAQPTPALQQIDNTLRSVHNGFVKRVQGLGTGALREVNENYLAHIWTDPQKAKEVYTSMRATLEGSKSFLKRRTYMTTREGYNSGLIPVSWNPIELQMLKWHEMEKYIRGQEIFRDFKKQGWVGYVKAGQKAPPGWTPIPDPIANVWQFSAMERGFIQRGKFYAPAEISELVDRYFGPGLRGQSSIYDFTRSLNNSMNQAQLGLSAFHASTTAMNSAASHLALSLQKFTRGEWREGLRHAAIGLPGAVPGPLGTPGRYVAMTRDAFWGNQIRRSWRGLGKTWLDALVTGGKVGDPYEQSIVDSVRNWIDGGGNMEMSRPFIDNWVQSWQKAWQEGRVGKGIVFTPHAFLEYAARPIFQHIVPLAKFGAAMDLGQEELAKLPPLTREVDKLVTLSKVQNSIDSRFGELNYDKLHWGQKIKDLAFITLRAVGWNVGDIREFGGGIKDLSKILTRREVTPRTAYAFMMPVTAALYSAAFQYAKTGTFPSLAHKADGSVDVRQSLINFLAPELGYTLPDGRPARGWLAGYQKDLVGAATHPAQTAAHKLSPLLKLGYQEFENENYFHVQIRDPNASVATRAGQGALFAAETAYDPITVQNFMRRRDTGDPHAGISAVDTFLGVTPANRETTNSTAQNMMDDIASGKHTTLTPELEAHIKLVGDLKKNIRTGTPVDLNSGQFSSDELRMALRDAALPTFQSRFSSIMLTHGNSEAVREGFDNAFRIYAVSTPDEKRLALPIITQKLESALRRKAIAPNDLPAILDGYKRLSAGP